MTRKFGYVCPRHDGQGYFLIEVRSSQLLFSWPSLAYKQDYSCCLDNIPCLNRIPGLLENAPDVFLLYIFPLLLAKHGAFFSVILRAPANRAAGVGVIFTPTHHPFSWTRDAGTGTTQGRGWGGGGGLWCLASSPTPTLLVQPDKHLIFFTNVPITLPKPSHFYNSKICPSLIFPLACCETGTALFSAILIPKL